MNVVSSLQHGTKTVASGVVSGVTGATGAVVGGTTQVVTGAISGTTQAVSGTANVVTTGFRGATGAAAGATGGVLAGVTAIRDNLQADMTVAERADQFERVLEDQAERLARIEAAVGIRSWRRRLMPQFVVTLPKYVIMDNPRLGLLHFAVKCFFLAFFIFSLTFFTSYNLAQRPEIKVSMCGSQCPTDAYLGDDLMACPAHSGVKCSMRCGTSSSAGSCLHPHEQYRVSKQGIAGAWIPTFYSENVSVPQNSGSCPEGFQLQAGACTKGGDFFVAGSEHVRMAFTHEISVLNDLSFVARQLYRSHQGAFHSEGGKWDESVTTILFDANGEQVTWWGQKNGGRFVNVSLQTLIESAWYGGVPEEGEKKAPITIDSTNKRPDLNMNEERPLRLTGAVVTVDLYVTDTGKCKVFDTLRQDKIRTVTVQEGEGRPVACMFVHLDQTPTYELESLPVGVSGSRERKTHGFRVRFRLNGEVLFLDEIEIARRVTMFCILMQIPLILVRFFVVTCLGRLSAVYGRVMNQELNLADACKGLAARLMSHSATFMDETDCTQERVVRSKQSMVCSPRGENGFANGRSSDAAYDGDDEGIVTETGVSKGRILSRIRDFLQNDDAITYEELLRMVDFLFDGLKSITETTKDDALVNLSEYCTACCTNEPLSFDSLVQLFDKDRKTGLLERIFVDDDIRFVHKAAQDQGRLQRGQSNTALGVPAKKTQGGAVDSNLADLINLLQELVSRLTAMEAQARVAAREVDADPEIMELLGSPGEEFLNSFPSAVKQSVRESGIQSEDEGGK